MRRGRRLMRMLCPWGVRRGLVWRWLAWRRILIAMLKRENAALRARLDRGAPDG